MSSYAAAAVHLYVHREQAHRDAERLLSWYGVPAWNVGRPRRRFSGNAHQRRVARRAGARRACALVRPLLADWRPIFRCDP